MNNDIRNNLWTILNVLTAEARPDWDQVSKSWVGLLLDCNSQELEKMVFKLGDPLRRRERTSLIAEIDKVLAVLSNTEDDELSAAGLAA